MKYLLKENLDIDLNDVKKYKIAERLGIHNVTFSNIINRRTTVNKALAFYITSLNGGTEKDIEKYFELVETSKTKKEK